jgi:Mesyanzhinovviridae DNA polymerase
MFPPSSDWRPPQLSSLPSWKGAKRVALDTEFSDSTLKTLGIGARRGAKICGYSFAIEGHEGGRGYYVPLRHVGGDNIESVEQGFNYLRDNLSQHEGELVGANLNVDLDLLYYENVRPNYDKVMCRDVQILAALIWELHHKYSLDAILEREGFALKDETLLREALITYGGPDAGKELIHAIPARFVGPYGEYDASCLLPLLRKLESKAKGLQQCWDLESRLLPVLLKIRQRGVLIDQPKLDMIDEWSLREEKKTLDEIRTLTGRVVAVGDCMKAEVMASVLASCGVQVGLTPTGMPSVTTASLAAIAGHPIGKLIRYTRQVFKLRSTFVSSIRRYMTNGRIHSTIRQTVGMNEKNEKSGAAFGRLSSAHLNIQQQPSNGPFAAMWRSIYIPDPGGVWGCLDYSQVEPRWTTHFAEMYGCAGAKEAADAYRNDPRTDNHTLTAKLTGLDRKYAKAVFLALCYGEGGAKLCKHQLKIPTRWRVTLENSQPTYFETQDEAITWRKQHRGRARILEVAGVEGQQILDTFNRRMPYLRSLSDIALKRAEDTGMLSILGGRVLHFPLARDGSYDFCYKALNRVIQGSSGIQMRICLLTLAKEMPDCNIQMTVHDEVDGTFSGPAEMHQAAEIMRTCVKARVPWRVDIEHGKNWGEMSQLCAVMNCPNDAVKDDVGLYYCEGHAHA